MSTDPLRPDVFGLRPFGEATKIAVEKSFDGAGAFLAKLCLPAVEEFGLLLRDKVQAWRAQNLVARLSEAATLIAAVGTEPRTVPMRTLLPLLEGASREDDPHLSGLWTALLARAADPGSDQVPPIFPTILSQLSPLDARVLHALAVTFERGLVPDPPPDAPDRWGVRRTELQSALPLISLDDIEVALTTLMALGVVADDPTVRFDSGHVFLSGRQEYKLSPLGLRFFAACTLANATQGSAGRDSAP